MSTLFVPMQEGDEERIVRHALAREIVRLENAKAEAENDARRARDVIEACKPPSGRGTFVFSLERMPDDLVVRHVDELREDLKKRTEERDRAVEHLFDLNMDLAEIVTGNRERIQTAKIKESVQSLVEIAQHVRETADEWKRADGDDDGAPAFPPLPHEYVRAVLTSQGDAIDAMNKRHEAVRAAFSELRARILKRGDTANLAPYIAGVEKALNP